MSDMCDHPGCTAPIVNGVPICHHPQTTDSLWEELWEEAAPDDTSHPADDRWTLYYDGACGHCLRCECGNNGGGA